MNEEADVLAVATTWTGGTCRVTLCGDVDASTAPLLDHALQEAVAGGAVCVVVDCADVSLFSAAGVSSLITARQELHAGSDDALAVTGVRPSVERVLAICGLANLVTPHASAR